MAGVDAAVPGEPVSVYGMGLLQSVVLRRERGT